MVSKLDDIRTWFYYPIEVPINKHGHGPCDILEAVALTYEVWDRNSNVYASFESLSEAINYAIERNRKESLWERPD